MRHDADRLDPRFAHLPPPPVDRSPGRRRPPLERRGTGAAVVAVVLVGLAAVPFGWLAIGDASEPGLVEIDGPTRGTGAEPQIGAIGVAILVAGLAAAAAARRRGGMRHPWPGLVVLAAGLGVWCALVVRVVDARVTGANIGAGLLVIASPAVIVGTALSGWALVEHARDRRADELR